MWAWVKSRWCSFLALIAAIFTVSWFLLRRGPKPLRLSIQREKDIQDALDVRKRRLALRKKLEGLQDPPTTENATAEELADRWNRIN